MSQALVMIAVMKGGDPVLAGVAERQLGLCTLEQALAVGMTRKQVRVRVERGRWITAGRGVYRINGAPLSWQQRALAAVLGGPPETAVSHFTAAALQGLGSPPPIPHVTVRPGHSPRSPLAVVHRAALLDVDRVVIRATPTTAPARTLVDCARLVREERLVRLVDDAFHAKLTTVGRVERALTRADGRARPGCRALRQALDPWRSAILPDSAAEARLLRQLEAWGFPPAVRQVPVFDGGIEIARIDVGWPSRQIGIEYDSDRWHGQDRWHADEARHRKVTSLGWILIHADKADLRPGERSLHDELRRHWTQVAARPPAA